MATLTQGQLVTKVRTQHLPDNSDLLTSGERVCVRQNVILRCVQSGHLMGGALTLCALPSTKGQVSPFSQFYVLSNELLL